MEGKGRREDEGVREKEGKEIGRRRGWEDGEVKRERGRRGGGRR